MPRKPTGIPQFDALLGGGFPDKCAVLVLGQPGSGKSTLCREFAYTGLREGDLCLYVTTNEPPSSILRGMKDFGWDADKYGEKIAFVDCYSWRLPQDRREKSKYTVPGPAALNELSIIVESAAKGLGMDKSGGRIILDSVSDLLMQAQPAAAFGFIQVFVSLARRIGATALIVLDEGPHPPSDVATLNYLTDGTVEMRMDSEKRSIRITRMQGTPHGLKWVEFKIIKGIGLRIVEFFA